jgi:ATP-binding cassette subfamily B protein
MTVPPPGPPRVLASGRTRLLARLVAVGLLQAAAVIAVLLIVRFVFDALAPRRGPVPFARILWVAPALLGVAAARGWLSYQSRLTSARLGREYSYALIMHLYDHLAALSTRSRETRSHGAVMMRFTNDIGTIRRWISRGLAAGTVAAIVVACALGVLARLSLALAGAVVLCLAAEALASRGPVRAIRGAVRRLRKVSGRLMAAVGEQTQAMGAIQAFGRLAGERERFARRSRSVLDAAIVQARAAGRLRAVTSTAAVLTRGAILVAGAFDVAAGRTTLGTVAAALTVAGLLAMRVRAAGRIYVYYQRAHVARRKIRQFLETPPRLRVVPRAADLEPGPGRIEFDRVTLEPGLREVSVAAAAGMRVALVGPNGAGKSTLLALAGRLIDPDAGRVLLDGQDLAGRSPESVRRTISLDSPDLPLLRGTVGYNLDFRRPDATSEEKERVRKLCGVDTLLADLPNGERSRVREGGRNLSLGQRQRIGLARALLGGPTVLLLDEADANLDEEAGRALDAVLAGFHGTVIMVSHRAERVEAADAVWHLEAGRLVGVEQRRPA